MNTRLKDGGVYIDWSELSDIKAWLWSDAQKALAGRCDARIDAGDSTKLICEYASTKAQYPGVNRLIVQATYMGATKTYDKPVFNFVRWTGDQAGQQVTIDDPEVDVEIEVQDVSSSILDAILSACVKATAEARDVVDVHRGPAAGFGVVDAEADENVGTPEVEVETSGDDAAKNFHFKFKKIKGVQGDRGPAGVESAVVSVDQTVGDPSATISIENGVLTLALSGIKGQPGQQGNPGSSVDYPFELVNNRTTNDATKGLSAAEGYRLGNDIADLDDDVDDLRDDVGEKDTITKNITVGKWYDNKAIYATTGAMASSTVNASTNWISISGNDGKTMYYTRRKITAASTSSGMAFYDSNKRYISGETFITNAAEAGYEVSSITIPQGAKYVRFCFPMELKSSFAASIGSVVVFSSGLGRDVSDLQVKTEQISQQIGDAERESVKTDIEVPGWTDGKSVIADGNNLGTLGESASNSVTGYMDVSMYAGKEMTYTRKRVSSTTSRTGMAFYDSSKNAISGELAVRGVDPDVQNYELSTIEIPSNAAYARFTFTTSLKDEFEAYVYVDRVVYSDGLGKMVQDLEEETETLAEGVAQLESIVNALDADKNEKIFPLTTMGELQSGVIATSYSSEYAVVNVKKYRGAKIFVNNLHSATGGSEILDGADNVLATFSGVGTKVGGVTIPNDAVKMIVSNDFVNNTDFFISVPADLVRNDGLIFGENFLSDYDEGDFSQFNGSVVTDKGLQLSDTGAANGLILNKVVALDNWSLVADVMTEDNTEAVSLGTKMTQPGTTHHSTRVSVDFDAGTIALYNNYTGALVTSSSISSIVDGNIYTIKLERVNRAIYATLVNRKTGASVSINSQDGAEGSGNEGLNPAGKMFDSPVYYVGSGTPYLQNIYASCLRNAKVFIVGDSITAGAHTTWETSWAPMAAAFFGNSLTGGRGSGQVFCCLNQLRTLLPVVRPKAVVVTIGTNYTSSMSKSGHKAMFQAILNLISYYGAIPVINNVPACDDRKTNLTKINEIVNELKQIGCRFDLATSLNNDWADGQDTQFYYEDNVHLNVAGNALLYDIITSQLGWLKNI